MELSAYLRIQAHANALANHRLHTTMAPLDRASLHAPRVSFFPSLIATLNHVLNVDGYYIAALQGKADADRKWKEFVPADVLPELAQRQRVIDAALIAFCSTLDAAACEGNVDMPRGNRRIQRDLACHVLAHLFMHQTHHRGQIHTMLSGTALAPPQLDEFLMASEGHLRRDDMAALGWREEDIWGP